MSLTTSITSGGTNSRQTTAEEANALATDLLTSGVIGTKANTGGVAPSTGGFAVNAQGTPDMTVAVSSGVLYTTGTPTGGNSQRFRTKNSASANVTISANATGGTRYDWLYLKIDPDKAANPNSSGTDVATLVTSRSTSATTDNGTPPTYSTLLAVVTVSNGAVSITNGNISDQRSAATSGINSATSFIAINDFVESGCVWSGDSYGSTLAASMTSGYIWIGGSRLTVAAVSARSFTASKDTYVDASDNGDGTAVLTYTEATNNAASSALSTGRLRLAIIVSGASSIAAAGSVNQGQEGKILPIVSSVPYAVSDSLGNLICPRDPMRKVLGYRQIVANTTTTSATYGDVTGLSAMPIFVPTGRKIKLSLGADFWGVGASATGIGMQITDSSNYEVAAVTATGHNTAGGSLNLAREIIVTPSTSSITYKLRYKTAANTLTLGATATSPAFVKAELI